MIVRLLIIILLITSVCSCHKPSPKSVGMLMDADTLKPGRYFPAFPNSYWSYINDKNDTIVIRTGSAYALDQLLYNNGSTEFHTVSFYGSSPIWGLKRREGQSLILIVTDTLPVGARWDVTDDSKNSVTRFARRIIAKDSSLTVLNKIYSPTIVVEEYISNSTPYPILARYYYTKDIGLVKEESFSSTGNKVTKQIINYQIGK